MKTSVSLLCTALLIMAPWATAEGDNSNQEEHGGLMHHIATPQYGFVLGALVEIDYLVTNVTADTIYMLLRILIHEPVAGDLIWTYPFVCFGEMGWGILPPGDSIPLQCTWDMTNAFSGQPIDDTGVYLIRGGLDCYDSELQHIIELQVEVVPPGTGVSGALCESVTWSRLKALYR
jgi:hypothetical protein